MPWPIKMLLNMVCKTPSYLAMKMARITITKNRYRDNVAHALSLGRVDQGGLLDLMLLYPGKLVSIRSLGLSPCSGLGTALRTSRFSGRQ